MNGGRGWVTVASWLSEDVLAVVGAFPEPAEVHAAAWLEQGGSRTPLDVRCVALTRADGGSAVKLLTIALGSELRGDPAGTIIVAAGGENVTVEVSETTDVRTLAREGLAWLDAPGREIAVDFFAATPVAHGVLDADLNATLRLLRNALREPLPAAAVGPDEATILAVDAVVRVDRDAFYVKGWLRTEAAPLASLVGVSPEGVRVELVSRIWRHSRPDVVELIGFDDPRPRPGFVAYLELPYASPLNDGWVFELRDQLGNARETGAPAVVDDSQTVIDMLIGELALERLSDDELRRNHLAPALTRLQRSREQNVWMTEVLEFGTPPVAPDVSIIIPLYGRLDFLELQLAQFADDSDIRASDLLYVLDSPELADQARETATDLYELYGLPFRLALLSQNGGFAVANNRGASIAHGRLLLLLNSDVIPDHPGWLTDMCVFHDATPRLGAVAPKLLYEDDSIQHAGLHFHRSPANPLWWNGHFYKGLHRSLPAANVTRPVPAVTAACMMVARDRFDEVGGLNGMYVQGDYEDSDFCLRLREAGYDTWYLASVELYHLEGQSYSQALRERMTQYNRWLHSQIWGPVIESLMASWPESGSPAGRDGRKGNEEEESAPPEAAKSTPEGRAAVDVPRTEPPTTKPQLTALVEQALLLPYTSESGEERILTGNHYQSVMLAGERRGGFRAPRSDILDCLRFEGKTVLDLGSNLGEISREARARGAALVDGFEHDPFFVEVAQAVNALNDVTRVSFFRRDVTDPSVFTQPYDVVLAFSVWVYAREVLDRLAEITGQVLVVETHKLDDNLESEYIEPITRHFPYYAFLGETEWSAHGDETLRRAVIAFAKTRAALMEGLTEPVVVHCWGGVDTRDTEETRRVDSFRTPWYDEFFSTFAFDSPQALLEAVGAMELDVDALARLPSGVSNYSWPYWLLFVKGYLQYRAAGLEDANVYIDYLLRFFGPLGGDPGLASELTDAARAAERVEWRFRAMEVFELASEGTEPEVDPVLVVSRRWPSRDAKAVYEAGSSMPVEASLLDGYHRLFAARLFGVRYVPADFVVQDDGELPFLPVHVEELAVDGDLRLRGWITAEADAIEVWCGERFIMSAGLCAYDDGAGVAGSTLEFDVRAPWPADAHAGELRVVATLGWKPIASAAVAPADAAGTHAR